MSYHDRLQSMIEKGTINPAQAKMFSEGLERLTPPAMARKPFSIVKLSLSLLGLLVAGTVIICAVATPESSASDTIQNVAASLNQPGATGNMGTSVTSVLALFLLLSVPVAAVLFFVAGLYNQLVGLEEDVKKTEAFVANGMTRKRDLIPQMETLVQSAMKYEETLQHSVAETRGGALQNLQQALAAARSGAADSPVSPLLNAAVEAYPQLKAQDSVQALQQEMARIEEGLLIARNIHAAAITDFNQTARGVFGGFVAGLYGFRLQLQTTV